MPDPQTVGQLLPAQSIRQPNPIAERVFEMEFLDPSVQAFALTFG
jgi:hypothetical protein